MTAILSFAVSIVPLIYLLFQEFFSAQARAREQDKEFQIDQANLKLIVDAAVQKWVEKSAKDSADASNAWDRADEDKKP